MLFWFIVVPIFVATVVVPWLRIHAVWIGALIAIWVVSEAASPDAAQVADQRITARSFDESKVTVTKTYADIRQGYETLSATIRNGGPARIYDVSFRCRFTGKDVDGSQGIGTENHSGYILPGQEVTVTVNLDNHGYTPRADPNSFTCTPKFQVEKSDLFKQG